MLLFFLLEVRAISMRSIEYGESLQNWSWIKLWNLTWRKLRTEMREECIYTAISCPFTLILMESSAHTVSRLSKQYGLLSCACAVSVCSGFAAHSLLCCGQQLQLSRVTQGSHSQECNDMDGFLLSYAFPGCVFNCTHRVGSMPVAHLMLPKVRFFQEEDWSSQTQLWS